MGFLGTTSDAQTAEKSGQEGTARLSPEVFLLLALQESSAMLHSSAPSGKKTFNRDFFFLLSK